jgi:hypothetical protein
VEDEGGGGSVRGGGGSVKGGGGRVLLGCELVDGGVSGVSHRVVVELETLGVVLSTEVVAVDTVDVVVVFCWGV